MDLTQALNIIAQLIAQVAMPLQGHQQAQEALRIVTEATKTIPTPKKIR